MATEARRLNEWQTSQPFCYSLKFALRTDSHANRLKLLWVSLPLFFSYLRVGHIFLVNLLLDFNHFNLDAADE